MLANVTPEILFSTLQREKSTGELIALQQDFYQMAERFIRTLEDKAHTNDEKEVVENSKAMLAALVERRKQKVLLYIAYNKQLPAAIPTEEESLYNEITNVINQNMQQPKPAKFRILADIPEVLTKQGKRIGPYKQGEVIELFDSSDAEFVAENKIGEAVA